MTSKKTELNIKPINKAKKSHIQTKKVQRLSNNYNFQVLWSRIQQEKATRDTENIVWEDVTITKNPE